MEHNIDKQFKRELDQRTIRPSVTSWDRLDAMLEVADSQKPAKKRYWLAIAASIIGLLGIGIAVMISLPTATENQLVLETKTETKVQNQTTAPGNIAKPEVIVESNTETGPSVAVNPTVGTSRKTSQNLKAIAKRVDRETPANTRNFEQETTKELIAKAPQSNPSQDKGIEPKVETKVVNTNSNEFKIAALEKEIPAAKSKKFTVKVDPAKLLATADEDPRTLMQRMYTVATNTGQTVASLLSTRNVEHK